MKWLRRVAWWLAISAATCWVWSAYISQPTLRWAGFKVSIESKGLLVLVIKYGNQQLSIDFSRKPLGFELTAPGTLQDSLASGVSIPHWLTNLITWSLFFILWRNSRKHLKGHCQGCGYDLTGNTTGVCPECNSEVASQTEAIA